MTHEQASELLAAFALHALDRDEEHWLDWDEEDGLDRDEGGGDD